MDVILGSVRTYLTANNPMAEERLQLLNRTQEDLRFYIKSAQETQARYCTQGGIKSSVQRSNASGSGTFRRHLELEESRDSAL